MDESCPLKVRPLEARKEDVKAEVKAKKGRNAGLEKVESNFKNIEIVFLP